MNKMKWNNFFTQRKRREQELKAREEFLNGNLQKTTAVQETNAEVQKELINLTRDNHLLTEEIRVLVTENEKTKNLLLERENQIKKQTTELDERVQIIRKEEILIETRKSDLRRKEQDIERNNKEIERERKTIKEREIQAETIRKKAQDDEVKYEELCDDLKHQREKINELEKELQQKNIESDEKNAKADSIFERAKIIDEEIKLKEKRFEEERLKIETSLKEKLDEVDRRLADLDNVKGIVNDIKYDDSEEGRSAKIVVKEAIRKAKNMLNDLKTEFEELDEKYASGTFKGFSIPITEIDKCFEELKVQYEQIKAHVDANPSLPASITKWLTNIEDCILKADTSLKSWEFSEVFRSIILGLAACRNYELLLEILSAWGNSGAEEQTENNTTNEEFTDWYDVLEVDPDATAEEIEIQFKKLIKIYHPDKVVDEEKKKEFEVKAVLLNEARSILTNESKRKEFDEKRNKYKQKNT
jgi:hypothetical protein